VRVRVFDQAHSAHADELVLGDIRDGAAVQRACAGMDVVVHAAAMIDWGDAPAALLRAVNLDGTEHVIAACRAEGVRALVHTSTMDVVFDGTPLIDVDERHPYPERFLDGYGRFKADAERAVLAADGSEGARGPLRTVALRPCGMYGERDPYHLGNVLGAARAGRLVFRVGDGKAVFEHVYVGNVAHAHAVAAFALALDEAPRIAGRAYFVTDQRARNFFDFMAPFVEAMGHRMPSRALPTRVAWTLGLLAEAGAKAVGIVRPMRPKLTRSSVRILTTWQSMDGRRLREDLGWAPRYTEEEAFERSVRWFRENPPDAS
jgi:nucleoside-diphosphate-sugar epimerase